MSKAPSEKTMLIRAKQELRRSREDILKLKGIAEQYRVRASEAEQDAKEWKERFDILLRKQDDQL